ncbi:MAG: ABC transporter ATP-binding protein [Oscillatoriophycideae cyanobacterium NC_groundwater_1537_Pr4_S-0.65um_50_18]|nr:ABC transporter ATP-binding protein [Oscillatoriophycideae cyanobacterium NC_groundwater_1537_Pr4_S-0.65um_50_18]
MAKFLKKIWFILGSTREKLPFLLMLLLISSVTETLGIGLLAPFFAIVSNPGLIQSSPVLKQLYVTFNVPSNEMFIVLLCGLIIFIFILKSLLYFLSKFYILKFSHSHRGAIIKTLNQAYLHSEYNYFARKNSSDLIKNIIVETQNFCYLVLLALLYGISNFLILVLLLALMAFTNLLLLVTTLAALLPVFLFTYAMKNRLKAWGKDSSESQQKMIQTLNHGLGGLKETRVIGCESYFEDQMSVYTKQYGRASSLTASFNMMPRILIESVLVSFIVALIAVSQLLFSSNADSLISSLSVFAVAAIRLLPAASQVVSTLGNLQSAGHAVDVLYADLKEAEQHRNPVASITSSKRNPQTGQIDSSLPMQFTKQVRLSSIVYRYAETLEPAINKVSLEIRKGESIAFIGKSGAGKTTLVDIILGLLTPQSGDITVDGVSIYRQLRAWQNLVGYIPQTIFLLDDTIERNIAFGVPDHLINHQKLEEAIAAAQLEDLMVQLPNGIQTRVGERGMRLSGGQRQRIGIARALYHEREILVLDEATSALDNETEQLVSDAIRALSGKKTVIIIAHRLSTVEHCDRVYLMEQGQVVKSGSYAEVVTV